MKAVILAAAVDADPADVSEPSLSHASQAPSPPVPKLKLPPITVQSGAQFTIPFDGKPVTVAHPLQITATLLKGKDGKFRPESQAGVAIVDTPRGGGDRTDLGIVAVVSTGDLPGSTHSIVWSVQAQVARLKSLTDRAGSGQLSPFAEVDGTVFERQSGQLKIVTIKLAGQAGIVGESSIRPAVTTTTAGTGR